jgi:hypothetical protein
MPRHVQNSRSGNTCSLQSCLLSLQMRVIFKQVFFQGETCIRLGVILKSIISLCLRMSIKSNTKSKCHPQPTHEICGSAKNCSYKSSSLPGGVTDSIIPLNISCLVTCAWEKPLFKAFRLWNNSCATPLTCPRTVLAIGQSSPRVFSTPMLRRMLSLMKASPVSVAMKDQ